MKKFFKTFLTAAFISAVCMTQVSCQKDNKEDVGTKYESLVGTEWVFDVTYKITRPGPFPSNFKSPLLTDDGHLVFNLTALEITLEFAGETDYTLTADVTEHLNMDINSGIIYRRRRRLRNTGPYTFAYPVVTADLNQIKFVPAGTDTPSQIPPKDNEDYIEEQNIVTLTLSPDGSTLMFDSKTEAQLDTLFNQMGKQFGVHADYVPERISDLYFKRVK